MGLARNVTDKQAMAFFEEKMVAGKVYISSGSSNHWICSLALRNEESIKEFIELFGRGSKLDGTELTTDGPKSDMLRL